LELIWKKGILHALISTKWGKLAVSAKLVVVQLNLGMILKNIACLGLHGLIAQIT